MFAYGTWEVGSIPGGVIPKTQKLLLDASLLNSLHYKVRIKRKMKQSRERSSAPPTPQCSSYWKGAFGSPLTTVANFTYISLSLSLSLSLVLLSVYDFHIFFSLFILMFSSFFLFFSSFFFLRFSVFFGFCLFIKMFSFHISTFPS